MNINKDINSLIINALREDDAPNDITSRALIDESQTSEGYIIFKSAGVLCGMDVVRQIFQNFDKKISFNTLYKEGGWVPADRKVTTFKGNTRAILAGERTALNFLSHLSGIATTTREFVDAVKPYKVKILDTRKTTPGLRILERYAVRTGGGCNHRFNLSDMVLIKDNHRKAIKGRMNLVQAVNSSKAAKKPVEIEVNTLTEFNSVLPTGPDLILLDNMSLKDMKTAVLHLKKIKLPKKPLLEASGGINIKNVRKVASTGVDRISIGALTHSRKPLDISMELTA